MKANEKPFWESGLNPITMTRIKPLTELFWGCDEKNKKNGYTSKTSK